MTAPTQFVPPHSPGFTLVEMIVTLTILGLVSVAMFGGVRFGTAAWRTSAAKVDVGEQIRGAQDFLRRTLTAAYPLLERPPADPTSPPALSFEGERTGLRARALLVGQAGLQSLSVVTEADAHGLALVAELVPPGAKDGTRREIILADLREVEFAYLSPAANGASARWEDRWTGRGRLPELIRIRVAFRASDSRVWPDLFVAPRIGGDISCRVDLQTGECTGR